MSVGIEIFALMYLVHGAVAFLVGFLWSCIPRKAIGLTAFALFYLAIGIGYTAAFNFHMLINTTLYVFYVVVGLVGFVCGVFWLGKGGYYKKSHSKKEAGTPGKQASRQSAQKEKEHGKLTYARAEVISLNMLSTKTSFE